MPYNLNSYINQVPISIVQKADDFDLLVSEVRFSELLKRWSKLEKSVYHRSVLELNAPITEGDHCCDFSGVGGVN
jgi:hypothetical protein